MGRFHAIVSTPEGCRPRSRSAREPASPATGWEAKRSSGQQRPMRNSKCSCQLTVTVWEWGGACDNMRGRG